MNFKRAAVLGLALALPMITACSSGAAAPSTSTSGSAPASGEIIVGLITKTETNPFFVKMKEGAQAKADELGAKLLTGAGAKMATTKAR